MMGRREFGLTGLSAIAVATMHQSARGAAAPQPEKSAHAGHGMHEMFEKCATACSDCQRECNRCATHCAQLLKNGHAEHAETLATCQDCADICVAAAQIVARGGPFTALVCRDCAEACARCAKACEKFPDDKHMKACAEICRKCEKACKEMIEHAGHARHD